MTNIISYKAFEVVDIRVGTIISAEENLKNNNIDKIIYKTYMSAYKKAKILGKKN